MLSLLRSLPLALAALGLAACTALPAPAPPPDAHATSFDGLPIAYDVAGAGEPALVFVHGWCGSRELWNGEMAAFAGKHRVVALDLGGHGASGRERKDWTVEAAARDVRAVIEREDLQRVVLVGHAMGGTIALSVAALLPERVIGVVGVDTLHTIDQPITAESLEPILEKLQEDEAGFFRAYAATFVGELASPAQRAWLAHEMAATPLPVALGLMRSMPDQDFAKLLAACPVPVRCINSVRTHLTDVAAARAVHPDFDVVTLDDTLHFPMLENRAELDARLREAVAALAQARTTPEPVAAAGGR